jgi:Methyltransferase domain
MISAARDITPPLIWRFAGRLVAKIRPAPPKHNPMVKDPFLELALRSIVPGWLHQGNVELFDYCFANLPSGAPVVEIGSFAGLSLITIIHLLKRHGRSNPVFSVDEWTWPNPNRADVFRADTVSLEEHRHLVIESFRRNVSLYSRSKLPYHIVAKSDRFFAEWAAGNSTTDFFSREVVLGGPISFAYIDGDHSYEQSLRDFQNIDRYLEVGGFVVFDDSMDESPWQCARTAREAAKRSDYRFVDKRPNYCLQKIRDGTLGAFAERKAIVP